MKRRILLVTFIMIVFSVLPVFAGTWEKTESGWMWNNGDGTYAKNGWQWCDGNSDGVSECYFFNTLGFCLMNTATPDGCTVNEDGAWVVNGVVQTQGTQKTVDQIMKEKIASLDKYKEYGIEITNEGTFINADYLFSPNTRTRDQVLMEIELVSAKIVPQLREDFTRLRKETGLHVFGQLTFSMDTHNPMYPIARVDV